MIIDKNNFPNDEESMKNLIGKDIQIPDDIFPIFVPVFDIINSTQIVDTRSGLIESSTIINGKVMNVDIVNSCDDCLFTMIVQNDDYIYHFRGLLNPYIECRMIKSNRLSNN